MVRVTARVSSAVEIPERDNLKKDLPWFTVLEILILGYMVPQWWVCRAAEHHDRKGPVQ